jgi:putative tricarboxylic transport membrane protein
MWVKLLKIPYSILFPIIILLCIIGVYSISFNVVEIFIMLIFGIIGYIMKKTDFEGAPLTLAFILAPLLENSLKQSLRMSDGSFAIFILRPISAILIGVAFLSMMTSLLPWIKKNVGKLK